MGLQTGSSDANPKVHDQVEYRVKGRILHTTARGPFKELVEEIPVNITELIQKLARQGQWGQIVTFQHSAFMPPIAVKHFGAYLKLRYENPEIRPVVALVFAPDINAGPTLVQDYLNCYLDAGVKSQVFEDYVAARDWVETEISHFSTRIEWSERYRVGDQAIDEQHRELFKRGNYVLAATSHEGQVISAMRLFQYMRTHLSHEEELMRRLQYPKLKVHAQEHQEIIARLNVVLLKIANEDMVKADLEELLGDWFLAHMETADTELARFASASKK
jgi:hemerythrin-like metal-binding protein